jgi:hypothetical protein
MSDLKNRTTLTTSSDSRRSSRLHQLVVHLVAATVMIPALARGLRD